MAEFSDEQRRDMTARLNNLRAANLEREKRVQSKGQQAGPADVLALQLRTLKSLVVGDDPDRQLLFDLAYQEHTAHLLGDIEAALEKVVVPRQGLFVPNGKH